MIGWLRGRVVHQHLSGTIVLDVHGEELTILRRMSEQLFVVSA